MGLSPHQVLSQLAEQERDRIQTSLLELERQRMLLEQKSNGLKEHGQQLMQERDQLLQESSTKASMLMMLGEAMQEQYIRLMQVGQGLDEVKEKESALRKVWIVANQKCEIHEKMQKKVEKQETRKKEHRTQQQMDDVFSARYAREVKH
ncbi:MAG: hypothetical protein Q9M18_05260 [Mariprofundaceae bacterium]|nr:hypothetical protein [Mariprofundaceae bacterium]